MHALAPDGYSALLPRIRLIPFNTYFAEVVLLHHLRGKVWVDRPENPSMVMIAHPYGMSLLMGQTEETSARQWLFEYLTNADKQRQHPEFLQVYPSTWGDHIPEVLGKQLIQYDQDQQTDLDINRLPVLVRDHVLQLTRQNFRFDAKSFATKQKRNLPSGFRIESIGSRFFDAWKVSVAAQHFWDSANDFDKRGVAFAVMKDAEPACIAFSSFVLDQALELGVETKPEYRGLGLAAHACHALIEHCLARGLEPVWSCRKGNVASERTALSLGFSATLQIPYFILMAVE